MKKIKAVRREPLRMKDSSIFKRGRVLLMERFCLDRNGFVVRAESPDKGLCGKRLYHYFLILLMVLPLSCSQKNGGEELGSELHAIFEEDWAFRLAENPFMAGSVGEEVDAGQLPDLSPEAEQKRSAFRKKILEKLAAIDREKLEKKDRINYDIFQYQLQNDIDLERFQAYLLPLNSEGGFITNFAYALRGIPLTDKSGYEKYLSRMGAFSKYVDQHLDLMRTGVEKGITQPYVILKNYKKLIESHLVEEPGDSPYFKPFSEMGKNVSAADKAALQKKAKGIIKNEVLPAFKRFEQFMDEEYLPAARRDELGLTALPNGKEWYEQRVKYFTTLPMSSEEIFQIGEKEVKRIKTDMMALIRSLDFKGSFADFLHFLRTDPQFYAKTPKELLKEAAYLSKKMDGKLPEFFQTLPRNSYGVIPVPDAIAPNYTSGRYSPGSLENRRSGNYLVNTFKLESRPLYALPALTLHEAVPGHHLQISLAGELEGLPNFRRYTYLSCYGEGWGLYAEWLGQEAGMYESPYDEFGRMTYEMWRACRLVVDVGLHAKGWTREQAVDFMASNTALSLHEVNTEIDRYIGWPAQALSYKMGELKIRELREKAEKELGNNFDIRAFHDVILLNGAVPLFVLEELVEDHVLSVNEAHSEGASCDSTLAE